MISYNIQRTNDLAQPELVVVNERDPVNYAVVDSEEVRECSKCGSKQFSFKQEKKRSILDVIQKIGIKDRLIMLHYRFAQFSCNYKKHLFTRRITFVRKGKRLTARLEQYVFRKCLEKPAVSVEHELTALSVNKSIKISDTEIQSTFLDVTRILDSVAPQVWATPKTMGIHRARIGKHDSYVVLNIEEECIIDLLRDSEYSTLKGFAEKIINANDVEVIWLDLDGKLVSNIKEIFPNAELRIGREQVERYLEKCIQSFLKEDRYKPNGMRESTFLKPREAIKSKETLKKLDEYLTEHQSMAKIYGYNQSIRSASLNQIKEVIQGISDFVDVPLIDNEYEESDIKMDLAL